MPIAPPAGAASAARTDVGLLDALSVYINFGERAAIAILPERAQRDFARRHERLQAALGRASTRFIQLGGIDVREPHLLVIAHQRIAIDRDAALAGDSA